VGHVFAVRLLRLNSWDVSECYMSVAAVLREVIWLSALLADEAR
jgi:hypothetical protein